MPLLPIVRDTADAKVGGVCAALARSLSIDPLLVRLGFVLFGLLTNGVGIMGYLALWGLVPARSTGIAPLKHWFPRLPSRSTPVLVIAVLVVCLILGGPFSSTGPAALVIIALVVMAVRSASKGRRTPPPAPQLVPRTPFERSAQAWEQRLANVDAGRPVDWVPESEASVSVKDLGMKASAKVRRRHGIRIWFGILICVGTAWSVCGLASVIGFTLPALTWASATLAVLSLALVWVSRPSRSALGRPPLLATATVLTGMLTTGMLLTNVAPLAQPLSSLGVVPSVPLTSGAAELGAGNHIIDYSAITVMEDSSVDYDMSLGNLTVVGPDGGNVIVNTSVQAGSITTPRSVLYGLKLRNSWTNADTPATPTLTINIRLSAGSVAVQP